MLGWLVRRIVLLVAALVVLTAALVMAGSATADGDGWTWWRHVGGFAVAACVVSIMVATATTTFWVRRHTRRMAALLTAAVPAAMPPPRAGDADLIAHIARRLADLMSDAGKDQAQLLTIISSMSDGLIATDHQQRILLTNAAAEELLAFRTRPATGKQLWEIMPVEAVSKAVTEVSLTGQQKTVSVGAVNGRHLDVTICRLPLRPAGFVIVAHDITEAMRYEELRKEFVANVSHELRTPLTVIKGYVETLQEGAVDDRERAMQYLATVAKHADQLTNLVNDLLNLSRLDSMPAAVNPRPVNVSKIAARVAELMAPAAQRKRQQLIVQMGGDSISVAGDSEQLERAFANLVDNAIKYTRDAGTIRLSVSEAGQRVIVEVMDNGIGISAADLPRIFERFYRADRSRSRDMGGTGLGLSIAKHIVQAHGGIIEVQSTPGVGSTFRAILPAAEHRPAEEVNS